MQKLCSGLCCYFQMRYKGHGGSRCIYDLSCYFQQVDVLYLAFASMWDQTSRPDKGFPSVVTADADKKWNQLGKAGGRPPFKMKERFKQMRICSCIFVWTYIIIDMPKVGQKNCASIKSPVEFHSRAKLGHLGQQET